MTRAFLVFTLARFLLFLLFAMLSWSVAGLLGYELNGFVLLIVALVLSSLAGVFLLAGPRAKLAAALAERQQQREA